MASQNDGIYDPRLHAQGVEEGARLPPGVSTADYVHAHVKRAKALASRGLIEALGEDRFRIPERLEARCRRCQRRPATPARSSKSSGFP